MTHFYSPGHGLFPYVFSAGTWLILGALIGALHFLTLRWSVWMLTADWSLPLASAAQLARFTVTAGLLAVVAVRFGAFPLVVASTGVLAARTAILRFGGEP
jgi:hypothetical protein